MILYRPVGTGELKLIAGSGYTAFPPRLPEQPIFYPVLNEKYACEIAFGWNVKYNEDHKGYVTKFEIDDDYAAAFEIHNVSAQHHNELWVPAEELPDFNRHIVGKIEVMSDSDEMIYVAEVMYETGELHFRIPENLRLTDGFVKGFSASIIPTAIWHRRECTLTGLRKVCGKIITKTDSLPQRGIMSTARKRNCGVFTTSRAILRKRKHTNKGASSKTG